MAKLGIDVSYWQGNIDFARVRESGISFAILREGFRFTTDKKFIQYVTDCKVAGVEVPAVYHFSYAKSITEAIREADFVVHNVSLVGLPKTTLIFYDFEYDSVADGCRHGYVLGPAECQAFTAAFCKRVREHGYRAGVYTNKDYIRNMYKNKVYNDYDALWLADYTGEPDYPCLYQQFSSKGKVAGIKGNVDMNKYYGTETTENSTDGITHLANLVIKGEFGAGVARKENLYKFVQKRVNAVIQSGYGNGTDYDDVIKDVITGKYGNSNNRKQALYEAVQARVNQILK